MSRRGHRFYIPEPLHSGERVELPERVRHQVTRVLRLRVGDQIVLFDGQGLDYRAVLVAVSPERVIAEIEDAQPSRPLPCPPISLAAALLRHDHFDLVVEKATELGVERILPLRTHRVVVQLDERAVHNRLARWQRIAIEASEQCGRGVVPFIDPPCSLADALERCRGHRLIAFWEAERIPSIVEDSFEPTTPVALFVGPEGGWTDDEITLLRTHNAAPRSLGPLILRAETAALAGIVAVRARSSAPTSPISDPAGAGEPRACAGG
ncbi:16S rRNA (uracil(1498)-N(3))-methyltransferase [Thermomicrobium sp. 4228-Ro]|uniref:16S rRNA (uracil(1498)-N(3))-methyltransferase n=1 Tax=Thermomicrobium sp. 4228-Ro TaxID=2993937 RepID=UPI00224966E7|nr:16S rRNA (uracil(1498)-N(3))-methyltransferase [Thermomicrobium sp. 4228-Ro]MCX2726514.1 16S rRNA (uracil(1498)-N(3))-methyltransferase [Thermomicrobium sp. 4228-Ro]